MEKDFEGYTWFHNCFIVTIFALSITTTVYVVRISGRQVSSAKVPEKVLVIQDMVTEPLKPDALEYLTLKSPIPFDVKTLSAEQTIESVLSYASARSYTNMIFDLSSQNMMEMAMSASTRNKLIQLSQRGIKMVNVFSTNPNVRNEPFLRTLPMLYALGTDDFVLQNLFSTLIQPALLYATSEKQDSFIQNVVEVSTLFPNVDLHEINASTASINFSNNEAIIVLSLISSKQLDILSFVPNSFSGLFIFFDTGPRNDSVLNALCQKNPQIIYRVSAHACFQYGNASAWNVFSRSSFEDFAAHSLQNIMPLVTSANSVIWNAPNDPNTSNLLDTDRLNNELFFSRIRCPE